jgi:hypothetical protein
LLPCVSRGKDQYTVDYTVSADNRKRRGLTYTTTALPICPKSRDRLHRAKHYDTHHSVCFRSARHDKGQALYPGCQDCFLKCKSEPALSTSVERNTFVTVFSSGSLQESQTMVIEEEGIREELLQRKPDGLY